MTQAVIDLLEAIQIEADYRKSRERLAQFRNCLRQPVPEHEAIGKAGKNIVVGHEGDACLSLPLFRDVLESRDPAPVGHWLMCQCQRPLSFLVQDLRG